MELEEQRKAFGCTVAKLREHTRLLDATKEAMIDQAVFEAQAKLATSLTEQELALRLLNVAAWIRADGAPHPTLEVLHEDGQEATLRCPDCGESLRHMDVSRNELGELDPSELAEFAAEHSEFCGEVG